MKTLERKHINVKFSCAAVLLGALCGLLGALFHWCIAGVTAFRKTSPLIVFLLPFAGLVSVFIYKKLRVTGVGTMDVLESINTDKPLPARVAAAIFSGSIITHLFGASCGKEGAALQLGGSISVIISRLFGFNEREKKMLTACGMSAFFSAVFGTPFGAAIFGTEVTGLKGAKLKERYLWLLPCLISSLVSWAVSSFLGTNAERFHIKDIPAPDFASVLKTVLLSLSAAAVSFVFYKSLHFSEHEASKRIKNAYTRIFIAGVLIVALTVISGTTAFNGGGIEIIDGIFQGEEAPFMGFLYKIIFTLISVAAGFKGGEIVPTLYVGATLGSVLSKILGISSTFASAIGMTGLFAGMTKCPVASFVIALEMFGIEGGAFLLIPVIAGSFLSGKGSLYIK